jgi:hypothetical protein
LPVISEFHLSVLFNRFYLNSIGFITLPS